MRAHPPCSSARCSFDGSKLGDTGFASAWRRLCMPAP
jgi:hypothetical protein